MSEILGGKKEELFLKMLLIEDRILKLALGCGPFTMSSCVGLSKGS